MHLYEYKILSYLQAVEVVVGKFVTFRQNEIKCFDVSGVYAKLK